MLCFCVLWVDLLDNEAVKTVLPLNITVLTYYYYCCVLSMRQAWPYRLKFLYQISIYTCCVTSGKQSTRCRSRKIVFFLRRAAHITVTFAMCFLSIYCMSNWIDLVIRTSKFARSIIWTLYHLVCNVHCNAAHRWNIENTGDILLTMQYNVPGT